MDYTVLFNYQNLIELSLILNPHEWSSSVNNKNNLCVKNNGFFSGKAAPEEV